MYPRVGSPSAGRGRTQQIDELLAQLPSCHPLNRDQSLFEVALRMADGAALRITLPPTFPQARPVLAVTRPLQHPWVDQAGGVTFPSLLSWLPAQSTLLAVVAEALSELQPFQQPTAQRLSPPVPQSNGRSTPPYRGSYGHSRSESSGSQQQQQQQQHRQHQRPQRQESPPPLPPPTPPPPLADFPELRSMSAKQLHRILVYDQAYRELVAKIAASPARSGVQRQLRLGNADLAAANLAHESEIAELRNQIAIIRSTEYGPAKAAYDAKVARQQAVLDKFSPARLVEKLGESAADVDAESEALYDTFAAGESTLEAFIQKHMALRRKYHMQETTRQAAAATLL
mmetsp:Transcript_17776/g.53527  ORF Transcript_17776/g.53527 Transcript_17776/m.53527 type:complete len:343 (+) Transcript_17776:205-1233(+)